MTEPILKPQIRYDGPVTIATGRSRTETQWKNAESSWSALVQKLSITTRTRETFEQYKAAKKTRRDEIKDVGGFVGGNLKGGKRHAGTVGWRSMITLDADHIVGPLKDFVFSVEQFFGYGCFIYTTHSHDPKSPRVRVIIPLLRPITPDEYQAISRRIAADINLDAFCEVGFYPHQLMYWPSTAADGEFVSELIDEPWINPDEVLARYPDWTDSSYWPDAGHAERRKTAETQGDPLTKPGLIGAFCRTYSIQAAIEKFLPGVYEPGKTDDRYTYAGGSTTGGLVLYEGKFAYSHHGTDPISGRLVNAFDLVRIHKFGTLDADLDPSGVPIKDMPSYNAMKDLAAADENVRLTLYQEKIASAEEDFIKEADPDWAKKIERNRQGKVLNTAANVILILKHDPALINCIALDDFAHRATVIGDLPWRKRSWNPFWTDNDDSAFRNYLSSHYDIKGPGIINDALAEIFIKNTVHPVRDYLDKLKWDGTKRLETLFIDYLGAENSPYIRAVTKIILCAAVARIYEPGIKFDNMLVLVGPQGIGKSYILKLLGRNWHSDSISTMVGKDFYEQLQGYWIIEMAELSALKRSEVEAVKQAISKQEDVFRVAYGRNTSIFPRQCVFFGTTNESYFLRDKTGNRRFWPVIVDDKKRTKTPWDDLTPDEVDQVWAEAVNEYQLGASLYLDHDLRMAATEIQDQHTEESEKTGQILEYLDKLLPEDWESKDLGSRRSFIEFEGEGTKQRDRVCALEIWVELFGGDIKGLDLLHSREINDILRRAPGWEPYKNGTGKLRFGGGYGLQRCYVKKAAEG
jgi:putative DNA primase/helicase